MSRNVLKIFIGGIPRPVTESEFSEYFGAFGDTKDCMLMKDGMGVSRGFGFVTCSDQATYDKILGSELMLRGRKLDSKRAVPQGEFDKSSNVKLFVGGLAPEVRKSDLQTLFSKFGEVVEAVVMMDTMTGNSRGFGFVTFKEEGSVNDVLRSPQIELGGRLIQCKRALPASTLKKTYRQLGIRGAMNVGGVGPRVAGYGVPMYSISYNSGCSQQPAPPPMPPPLAMTGYGQPVFSGDGSGAPSYVSKYGLASLRSVPQYSAPYGRAERLATVQGYPGQQSQAYSYQPVPNPVGSGGDVEGYTNQGQHSQVSSFQPAVNSNSNGGNVQGYANQNRYQPY